MKPFSDHFSTLSAAYAVYRPRYPDALFDTLAELAPERDRAWDCATGSGQAAIGLAERFEQVIATDASRAQVRSAVAHPRVRYAAAQAEAALANLGHALRAAGAGTADVTMLRVYIVDLSPADLPGVGRAVASFFDDVPPPASTWIGVQALVDPRLRIEIEAVAVVDR